MPGWTSLLVSIWFIGGMVTTAIGIIGEYVGKIYKEVKRRPRYFVEKVAGIGKASEVVNKLPKEHLFLKTFRQ